MLRNKQYNLYIIADAKADLKKFSVQRKSVVAFLFFAAIFVALVGFLIFHYCLTFNYEETVTAIKNENEALRMESSLLSESLVKTGEDMKFLNSRIAKLAVMVGVEELTPYSEGGGIGGFESINGEKRFSDLDEVGKDIEIMDNMRSELLVKIDKLENIYNDKFEILGYTPSIWPVKGILTHGFGWRKDPFTGKPEFHKALDISTKKGTRIVSPADGTIIEISTNRGYGKTVKISHGFGLTTLYAHLDSYNVKVGQKIKRGDTIAFVGSTGRSTGPHLHYEVWLDGKAVDPMRYMVEDRLSKF